MKNKHEKQQDPLIEKVLQNQGSRTQRDQAAAPQSGSGEPGEEGVPPGTYENSDRFTDKESERDYDEEEMKGQQDS